MALVGFADGAWAQGDSASPANAPIRADDLIAIVQHFRSRLHQITQCRWPAWSPEADAVHLQTEALVNQTLAIPELARSSLGSHWAEATDEQRQVFLRLFHDLIVMRLAAERPLPEMPGARSTIVLHSDGVADVDEAAAGEATQGPSIDYRLKRLRGRWQVVDIVLDGQSVTHQYREQFDRIIARDSFNGLIDRMRRKLS